MADLGIELEALPVEEEEPRASLSALDELRRRRQWVAWRYVERQGADGTKKPTKPPVNPHTGFGASHSDPKTWGTYEQAMACATHRRLAGVGIVLAPDDDYTGMDLDGCRDALTGEIQPWAQEIVALAETYSEVSPSGTGIRMMARGKVPKAHISKAAQVEVYGAQRYLTITGNHVVGTPLDIRPAPETISMLIARVEQFAPPPAPALTSQVRKIEWTREGGDFFRRVNDRALGSLDSWVGSIFPTAKRQPGTGAWRVSSRDLGRTLEEDLSISPAGIKDFGVHDMGDGRQGARTAIDVVMEHGGASTAQEAATWLCERLGVTPEAMGWQDDSNAIRLGEEIAAGLIAQQADGVLYNSETGEVVHDPTIDENRGTLPEHLASPPGLLGAIVEWICATSKRPSPALAVATAVAVIGTTAGRYWSGPTTSGTHFYIAMLGPTSAGKEHFLQCSRRLLRSANLGHCIGPDEFMSQSSVSNHVIDAPLSLCPMDELGPFLRRVQGKRASAFEQNISKTFRTLWGVNFGETSSAAYASRKATTITAPALTVLGASTAEDFWGALESTDISNGFVNRFMIFTLDKCPAQIEPEIDFLDDVPPRISDSLKAIHAGGNVQVSMSQCSASSAIFRPVRVPYADEETRSIFLAYQASILERFENEPDLHAYYARVAENAIRLATVYALGMNSRAPQVTRAGLEWAIGVVEWSTLAMVRGAGLYISETEAQANANRVLRILVEAKGACSRRTIMTKLKHRLKPREIDDVFKALTDSGAIVAWEVAGEKGGRPTRWYRIGDD